MRKVTLAIVAVVLLGGCATMGAPRSYYRVRPPVTIARAEAHDSTILVRIVSEDMDLAQTTIENLSADPITILWDKSSYSYPDGDSSRIVTGETRRIDINRSQPPLTIGPGNSTRETLVAAKAVVNNRINRWIAEDGEFLIAYEQREASQFLAVPFSSVETTIGDEILGYVTVEQIRWHPLFIGFPDLIRASLTEEASSKAKARYGDDIRVTNEQFSSEWHPLSLLIAFSLYGWVEEASLTITVLGPVPESRE